MATCVLANDNFIFALFKRIMCFVLFRLVVMLLAGHHLSSGSLLEVNMFETFHNCCPMESQGTQETNLSIYNLGQN